MAESFLPDVNGVTNSVVRVVEHLGRRGHDTLVIAPGLGPTHHGGTPVERVPAVVLDRYGAISVGIPTRRVERVLADFRPDVVHLAAPVMLGNVGLTAAARLGVPTVAVYQTDLPAFAREYGVTLANRRIWSWLKRVHAKADITLAPSTASVDQLRAQGIRGVVRWPRGVDLELFHPDHRDESLRRAWSPDGRLVVGYVGRLAPEKTVELLAPLDRDPRVQLVIVGDGPARPELERRLPGAVFHGFRSCSELAAAHASLDVFVHTGRHETFCQALQEALASGVPAIAPAQGGPRDLVAHGFNGLLWDPRDPATISRAVHVLLDAEVRAELASRARPSVTGRSWEAVGDALLDHYERLVGARSTAGVA